MLWDTLPISRREVPATKGEEKRVSLSISTKTKVMLDSVKHPGQSYNGLLQELVTLHKEQRRRKVESGG